MVLNIVVRVERVMGVHAQRAKGHKETQRFLNELQALQPANLSFFSLRALRFFVPLRETVYTFLPKKTTSVCLNSATLQCLGTLK